MNPWIMAGVGIVSFIAGCWILVQCGRAIGINTERFHEKEVRPDPVDKDS